MRTQGGGLSSSHSSAEIQIVAVLLVLVSVLLGVAVALEGVAGITGVILLAAFPLAVMLGRVYPQALLVVALLAGSHTLPGFIPLDLGYYFMIALALMCLLSVSKKHLRFNWATWCFLAAVFLMVVSFSYGGRTPYALDKWARILVSVPTIVFAAGLFLRNHEQVRRFMVWLMGAGIVLMLYALVVSPPWLAGGRLTTFGGGPITLGRIAGFTLLCALAFVIDRHAPLLLSLSAAIVSGAVVFYTGSRGPLIALVVAIVALLVLQVVSRRFKGRLLASTGALLAASTLFIISGAAGTLVDRLLLLANVDPGASALARVSLADSAMASVSAFPLSGVGMGGFGETVLGAHLYPHNLLLEVASENGLSALVLLVGFLVGSLSAAVVLVIKVGQPFAYFLFASIVFGLGNSMVSGDFNNNYVLFAVCLAAVNISVREPDGASDTVLSIKVRGVDMRDIDSRDAHGG